MNVWTRRSLWVGGGFVLFRLAVIGVAGLGDSESYYWTWSRHLDWSYYDHPGMVAWLIRLSTAVGGDSPFWVRLPSALLFAAIGYLFHRLSLYLFRDPEAAFWTLLVFCVCPMFSVAALQMVPDIPGAFFWMLYLLLVSRALREDAPRLWIPAGAALGLGFVSKYMAAPLAPATLLMLAFHRDYRKHLREPSFWVGAALAALCTLPIFFWNAQRGWPSFRFQLVARHGQNFEPKHMAQFLVGQALYLSPLIWFGVLAVSWWLARKVFVEKDARFDPLFWLGVPPLAFFTFIGLWTRASEPHWTAFGTLAPIAAWGMFHVEGSPRFRKYTRASLWVGAAMAALFYVHLFRPILPLEPKYDLVNELYGWDRAGRRVEELHAELPGKQGRFLMAHHWVLCSQLDFATQHRMPVYCVNQREDQFDFFEDTTPPLGADFVFVADNRYQEPPDRYYRFDRMEGPFPLEIRRGGKYARTFYLYKVYGYAGPASR